MASVVPAAAVTGGAAGGGAVVVGAVVVGIAVEGVLVAGEGAAVLGVADGTDVVVGAVDVTVGATCAAAVVAADEATSTIAATRRRGGRRMGSHDRTRPPRISTQRLPRKNRMCSTLRVSGLCDGRIVVITGAGRGIGRGHALEFARQGAKVVVNDIGANIDGSGSSDGPAGEVVDAIRAMGGEAVANGDDVADWDGAERLIGTAIDTFGGLDVVVNNAGFLRDRMLVSTSEEEWDAIMRVHLKGHFCPSRHASAYWREQAKAGETVDGRIVNTSSGAGLLGSVGQGNYSAAKAGIAALTLVQAAEMGRYGVTANAIAPAARTRMTEAVFADTMAAPEEGAFDAMAPENVAPLVVWLGSAESSDVTGRVFEVEGGIIGVADGWHSGPRVDKGARWEPAEVGDAVAKLLDEAPAPSPVYGSQ